MNPESNDEKAIEIRVSRNAMALVRTKMANDRTYLAYIRTSVALAASGAGLLKFWTWQYALLIGWPLIAISIWAAAYGTWEYRKAVKAYRVLRTLELDAVDEHIARMR